jgi:hypothetical protein
MGAFLFKLALLLSPLHSIRTLTSRKYPAPRAPQNSTRLDECVYPLDTPILIRGDPARRNVFRRSRSEQ